MTSFHGYVTYFDFVKSSNKGASAQGDLIVNPFQNGKVDPTYTSSTVVENQALTATADAPANVQVIDLKWCPVVPGTIEFVIGADHYFDGGDGKLYLGTYASKRYVGEQKDADGRVEGIAGRFEVDPASAVEVGTVEYGYVRAKSVTGAIYDTANKAKITLTNAITVTAPFAVNYIYNNIAIMQDDIPMVTMVQKGIYLQAKVRRIAINYSQMAAFQAKIERGEDIANDLQKVAVGTLKYEIDTEIVNKLIDMAGAVRPKLTFNATPRTGVSLSQHFEGFEFTLDLGRTIVYNETQKFSPNYMVCARNVLNVIKFLKGWKGANKGSFNGPFFAGTLDDLKVFVTPNINEGEYVLGVNGKELDTAAAIYAPFIAIAPTSVLQTPDGATTQGWSTAYALEGLNAKLLVKGKVVFEPQTLTITTA